MAARPCCAGCGSPRLRSLGAVGACDTWAPGSPESQLLCCRECGLGQLLPRPDAETLRRHYETGYLARRETRERLGRGRRELFLPYLKRLEDMAPGRKLLDLGCGEGEFLELAGERGWDAVGLELHRGSARLGAERGVRILEGSVEALEGECPFHAVTLWNVLDQMPDPDAEFRGVLERLAPGGVLLARVPNLAFHLAAWRLWRRLFRGRRAPTVFHPLVFDPRSLRRFLEDRGLAEVRVENSLLTASPVPGLGGVMTHGVRALARLLARPAELLSGGRWLVGPSLLAWGRRPGESGR